MDWNALGRAKPGGHHSRKRVPPVGHRGFASEPLGQDHSHRRTHVFLSRGQP